MFPLVLPPHEIRRVDARAFWHLRLIFTLIMTCSVVSLDRDKQLQVSRICRFSFLTKQDSYSSSPQGKISLKQRKCIFCPTTSLIVLYINIKRF